MTAKKPIKIKEELGTYINVHENVETTSEYVFTPFYNNEYNYLCL